MLHVCDGATKMHGNDRVETRHGQRFQSSTRTGRTRIVHEHVQPASALSGNRHGTLDVVLDRYVCMNEGGPGRLRYFLAQLSTPTAEIHLRAFPQKAFDDLLANAARTAGDQSNLVFQSHSFTL